MRLSIIVAKARNGAIGLRGNLLYHLPADMKRFKALTTGHTVLMGRKTFESLPKGALPNRRNVVLSKKGREEDFAGISLFHSLGEALADCQLRADNEEAYSDEVFIIGGASVYQEALPLANRLCLTCIDDTPREADTFFPEYESKDWKVIFREHHVADERHCVPFDFIDLERTSF